MMLAFVYTSSTEMEFENKLVHIRGPRFRSSVSKRPGLRDIKSIRTEGYKEYLLRSCMAALYFPIRTFTAALLSPYAGNGESKKLLMASYK